MEQRNAIHSRASRRNNMAEAASNKDLARRFYDAINKHDFSVIADLVADDFVEHEELPGVQPTKDGVRQYFEMTVAAFPDFQMVMEDVRAEGDMVVIRARMTGTHRGVFLGIPASGKQINVAFADFVRIVNGKAVEHWGVTDTGSLLQQIGAVEIPS
jgi:steroid delta-isomerase-like uncharacterized protein